jgi:transcriptional regulator with XRE-family HTH domain
MTPEQSRAARGWLGWTQSDLAAEARVGLSTVKDYESGKRTPIVNNLEAMRRAMESAGIKFTVDAVSGPMGAPGPAAPIDGDRP